MYNTSFDGMYNTSIDVYHSLPVDLGETSFVIGSHFVGCVIGTAESEFLPWHATDLTALASYLGVI